MLRLLSRFTLLNCFLLATTVFANTPSDLLSQAQGLSKDEKAALIKSVEARLPSIQVVDISLSPASGFYQIELANMDVIYMSTDQKHFMVGNLIRAEVGKPPINLTENIRSSKRTSALKNIPEAKMITYFPSEGKLPPEQAKQIFVFTDVTCGYCRKLHMNMQKMLDLGIQVNYLAWPRGGKRNPEAYKSMTNIWCAKDKQLAMDTAKQFGKFEPKRKPDNCDLATSYVDEQIELGYQMNVQGTPAIFDVNGRQLGGYVEPDVLLQQLSR